jgi:hypothetical protein
LGIYHLCENIDSFANALYFIDEKKYKPWSDETAQYMLTLRAKQLSNLWNTEVAISIARYYSS